jgi:hypothetical protein
MSITNYAELQTKIGNYLHRDLATIIPDFITLAEAKLNRRLRLRSMEQRTTGVVAATVALPTRFAEIISLTVTNNGSTYPVSYLPSSRLQGESSDTFYYSIIGDNIYFEPVGSGLTYTLHYFQKFDALSSGVNWLITNAPDIYLYASLLESAPYIKDDQRIATWGTLLDKAIADLERDDRWARYGNNLRMVAA